MARGGATSSALFLCIVCCLGDTALVPGTRDFSSGAFLWIKASLKWTRLTIKSYQPELRFGACAVASFPTFDAFPEAQSRSNPPPQFDPPPPPSPLPHFLLLETLSSAGASEEESLFVADLLALLFPTTFPPSYVPTPQRRDGTEKQTVEEAWQAALKALIVSFFGVSSSPSDPISPWEWAILPANRVFREETRTVPMERRRWTLVPLAENSSARVVGAENRGWRERVRSSLARSWRFLRNWMYPSEDRGGVGGDGLTKCFRDYVVEVLWRWVDAGTRSLKIRRREGEDLMDVHDYSAGKNSDQLCVTCLLSSHLLPSSFKNLLTVGARYLQVPVGNMKEALYPLG